MAIMSKKHLLAIADTRWESFLRKVSKIDKNFVERCKIFLSGHQDEFTMHTMPSSVSVIDELYNNLDIVPDGMQVLTATGNGDCLFNSVGKLLFGTEAVAPILRLVAAVDGIDHAEHFVNELYSHYSNIDIKICHTQRNHGTYIPKIVCSDFYHGLMSPCICRQQLIERPLNVMFVGASTDLKEPNHYVPLVWKISPRNFPENLQEQKIVTKFCAGRKLLGCIAVSGEKEEWVQCRKCYLHYNAVCSGIAVHKKEFVSCLEKDICIKLQRGNMNLLAHHFNAAARMSVLDSMGETSCERQLEMLIAFINAEQRKQVKPVTKFNLISNKIPKQVASMDYGTFMLYYISCVMKMDFQIIDSTIHIDETNSHEVGRNIRTSILRHIYDLRK
eukprot:gene1827-2051_t